MTMMQNVAAHQGSYCSLKKPKKKCQGPVFRESSVVCNESDIDHQILRFLFFRGLRMKIHLSGICAFKVVFWYTRT